MAFEVEIAVRGATAAKQAVASLGAEFERTEQKSTKAKDSMARFGGVVSGLDRARQATQGLAGAQSALAQGFAGVASALQREADMLERIHGPMRRHAADMQALQHLYSRGAISAREYTAEVDRMNRAVGAGRGGGLGMIGAAGAAGMAIMAGREVAQLSDSYTNLGNRIRQVSSSEAEHQRLMERTKDIANRTRSEWSATGEAFVRLTNASKDMGLGQERVLRLTETINKAFSMSGASSAEASAGMLQLSQAFASGRLQGDEFRTLAEAVPSILDMIAKEMGVSRGALKQLGSEGKITADVLVKAFENAKGSIDSGFAKSVPTLSQQMTQFKNDLVETANTLGSIVFPALIAHVKDTISQINGLASAVKTILDLLPSGGGGGSSTDGSKYGLKDVTVGIGSLPYKLAKDAKQSITDLINGTDRNAERIAAMSDEQLRGLQETQQQRAFKMFADQENSLVESEMRHRKTMTMIEESIAIGQRLRALDAPKDQDWLGITYGRDNPMETLRMATEGFTEASGVAMANMEAGWPNAMEHLVKSTVGAFDVLRPAAQGFFEADLPNWVDASTSAFDRLGKSAGGTLKDVMTKLGIGGNTGWGGLSDDEVRARMGKRSSGGATQKKKTDPWANLIPRIGDEEMSAFERYQTLVMGFVEHVKQASAEDPWAGIIPKIGDEQATMFERYQVFVGNVIAKVKNVKSATEQWNEELRKNELMRSAFDRGLEAVRAQATDVAGAMESAFTNAFSGVEGAIVSLVQTGKASFKDLLRSILGDIARLTFRGGISELFGAIRSLSGGGGTASVFGTGATQAFTGLFGGSHATGGSWTAPSTGGGPDSIPVMFRVSPNERVEFTPQGAASSGSGDKRPLTIVLSESRNEAELEDFVLTVIKRNAPGIRSAVTGR